MAFLKRVTCPHCWEKFAPEKILWVSQHTDLLGDPRLGEDVSQRFLPTRFNVAGEALDARGFPCHDLACPHCHLNVPRSLLEMEPLFFSIFGAPASGKSYLLAAMTWELRKVLPLKIHLSFSDADPLMNQTLDEYEESLFSNADPDSLIPLANLIRKTEEQGDLYDMVSYGTQNVSYPRPFLFGMTPDKGHPNREKAERMSKTICLYDNAGESFQPGKDSVSNPVTRHMAYSRALFFVFDPTQDSRFRQLIQKSQPKDNRKGMRASRQEPILQEAANRIRRFSGLKSSEKHIRPLIVILTKCDEWLQLMNEEAIPEPWKEVPHKGNGSSQSVISALDQNVILRRSEISRNFLLKVCPEIVTAAESFAENAYFIPVSAVGWNTQTDPETGLVAIKPGETEPYWVTVPFVFGLAKTTPGLVPVARKQTATEKARS